MLTSCPVCYQAALHRMETQTDLRLLPLLLLSVQRKKGKGGDRRAMGKEERKLLASEILKVGL